MSARRPYIDPLRATLVVCAWLLAQPLLAQSGSSRQAVGPGTASPQGGTVTASGVALNSFAGCDNASLDITLTSVGASRELGLATNASGDVLTQFEQATGIPDFSGTYVNYAIGIPAQPSGTLVGSYAYIGTTPPTAATTGEFFVLYNCTTLEVLQSCFGPYGGCPQTAQEALASAPEAVSVPALSPWSLGLLLLLTTTLGAYFGLSGRTRPS